MRLGFCIGLLILIASCTSKEEKKHVLPFIGNFDIEYKLVDGVEVTDTVYPTVPYFLFPQPRFNDCQEYGHER